MNDAILSALVAWAAMLSGYSAPDRQMDVAYVPHEFFAEIVCGGSNHCDVHAAYLDSMAPYIIFVDDKFRGDPDPYTNSIIVHEAVHAVQYHSGDFDSDDCDDSLERERQAYYVQNEFLVRNGHMPIIRFNHGVCRK